jgi:prephenate dehydrogenase
MHVNQVDQVKRVKKTAIIGLGLIGGSIGKCLVEQGFSEQVIGYDANAGVMQEAITRHAVHYVTPRFEDVVCDADLVILATPVGQITDIVLSVSDKFKSGAVITDVGSTKSLIINELTNNLRDDVFFIGGHPMTGSEQAGIEGADHYLFENAVYILTTPARNIPERAVSLVTSMVRCLGAQVVWLDPAEHDMIVACVSHLPHMLAVALVNAVFDVSQWHENVFSFTAGGFRDTTRIASGDINMWFDIIRTNSDKIIQAMEFFEKSFKDLKTCIKSQDFERIRQLLLSAKQTREKIPLKRKGFLTPIYETVIMVQDKPGSLSKVTTLLGDAGINIKDIEVLRIREGYGGTLRLGFANQNDLEKAIEILAQEGYSLR